MVSPIKTRLKSIYCNGLLYVFPTCNIVNFFVNLTFVTSILFKGTVQPVCAKSVVKPQSINQSINQSILTVRAHRVALISDSMALSMALAKAARLWIWGQCVKRISMSRVVKMTFFFDGEIFHEIFQNYLGFFLNISKAKKCLFSNTKSNTKVNYSQSRVHIVHHLY